MESWITWIIQVVAYGIICFLLKRELNQFDQRDKRLQERIDEVGAVLLSRSYGIRSLMDIQKISHSMSRTMVIIKSQPVKRSPGKMIQIHPCGSCFELSCA